MRPEHLYARRSKRLQKHQRAGLLTWRKMAAASLLTASRMEARLVRQHLSLQWRDRAGFSPASLFSPHRLRGTRTLLSEKNRKQNQAFPLIARRTLS